MLTLARTNISQEGDKHGKGKPDVSAVDAEPTVAPSDLDRELAWRLIDKVNRLNQREHSTEVHQLSQLGDYIRSVRRRLKLSRAELAIRSGLPFFFLIAIENGLITREDLPLDKLNRLSGSLGIPPDTLKAFLSDQGSVDCPVSGIEASKINRRSFAISKVAQLMKGIAHMSRTRKVMVMMVMGTLLMAIIAMTMAGRQMISFGM